MKGTRIGQGRRAVGRAAESADSDAAAVVLGVGIELGLSTAAQETGGTAWTANGRQV